jgi:transcriptional regulator with XRE-family HTH domain
MKLRLNDIREKHDLSQRKTAVKLKISKSYYNFFESGERIIPLVRLNDFSNLFHVDFDYALGITNYNIVTKELKTLDKKLIGERIREIRKKKKLTQKALADLLNTTQSTISSYENGNTIILTAFLYEMCIKLNVSMNYIVGKTNTIKTIIKS